ncbi:hypothetical protein GS944_02760 [Rhodococcus hoagii]|nr:hypothetical protein [Prescottella equi]
MDGSLVGHDYVLDTRRDLGAGGATGCTVVLAPGAQPPAWTPRAVRHP